MADYRCCAATASQGYCARRALGKKEKRKQREFGQRLIGARAWRAPLTPDRRELARQPGRAGRGMWHSGYYCSRLLTVILHHGRWRMLCRTLVCVGTGNCQIDRSRAHIA
jgi:hypothetical protein